MLRTTDTVKVQLFLDTVQKRAKTRTLDAEDIQKAVEEAEAHLKSMGVPQRLHIGCCLTVCENFSVDSSYFGTPQYTSALIQRKPTGWAVIDVKRSTGRSARTCLNLKKPALVYVVENLARGILL